MSERTVCKAGHQLTMRRDLYTKSRSCRRTKASVTAFDRAASMVKYSCSQLRPAPRSRSWCEILPPNSSFHSHTRATNSSRPRSRRVKPLRRSNARSTTLCVAMPAWSMPGTHATCLPLIRWNRASASWMVTVSACPMCSAPVTLGGGSSILQVSPTVWSRAADCGACAHTAAHRPSTRRGLNRRGSM